MLYAPPPKRGVPFRCQVRGSPRAGPPSDAMPLREPTLVTSTKISHILTPLPLLVDVNKVRSLRPGAGALLGHKKQSKTKEKRIESPPPPPNARMANKCPEFSWHIHYEMFPKSSFVIQADGVPRLP